MKANLGAYAPAFGPKHTRIAGSLVLTKHDPFLGLPGLHVGCRQRIKSKDESSNESLEHETDD